MASGKIADCGQIRKEKSENGRIWDEGKRVRKRINGVGGGADCGRIRKEKSENGRLWDEGISVGRKMYDVGKGRGLRTDPQRKANKWGGMRRREAARVPESEEFKMMKGGRIRHPRKSRVERR